MFQKSLHPFPEGVTDKEIRLGVAELVVPVAGVRGVLGLSHEVVCGDKHDCVEWHCRRHILSPVGADIGLGRRGSLFYDRSGLGGLACCEPSLV